MLSKDDPIIGEWYLVGKYDEDYFGTAQFKMIKPFTKGYRVKSYAFRKDSFDISFKKGQILNSYYKLINEGENVEPDRHEIKLRGTHKWEKSEDTYFFGNEIFGEIAGDTLKIYKPVNSEVRRITYNFKKE